MAATAASLSSSVVLHASAVAFDAAALVIIGPAGSGKSALALQLMALGATLVADDGLVVTRRDGGLHLAAPEAISGRIEARGLGILAAPCRSAWARAVVDLGARETARLPPKRQTEILSVALPLLHGSDAGHFPAALRLYMLGERVA